MHTKKLGARILIVDDHAGMRGLMALFLQGVYPECTIDESSNGDQALERVKNHPPELVLMDIHLPDANGLDLTAQIRASHPAAQVIVVTQYDSLVHRERAQAVGAIGYVVKEKLFTELTPLVALALQPAVEESR